MDVTFGFFFFVVSADITNFKLKFLRRPEQALLFAAGTGRLRHTGAQQP